MKSSGPHRDHDYGRRMIRQSLILLAVMTCATFGGPLAFGFVLRGGASRTWPPDRAVEWVTLAAIVLLVLGLMACAVGLAMRNQRAARRAKERVHQDGGTSCTFYTLEGSSLRDDGRVVLHATWYDALREDRATRTIGWAEILPSDADYDLWRWMLDRRDRFNGPLGPEELEAIRREFRSLER